jgi:hypothetical protein
VYVSTRHSSPIARGCGLELRSAAHIDLGQGRALRCGCHSHLLRRTDLRAIDLRAIRRILLSIDLYAFTASIPVRTSIPTRDHRNKANVARSLVTHRGLTTHKKPEPPCEVFGDDE